MSEARKQLRAIISAPKITRFDGMLLVAPEVATAVLDDAINVHVAAVEYGDEVGTTVHIATALDDLHREIRESIETEVLDMLVAEWRPEVYEYVARRRGDGSDWADWHGELHEIDGTPWVTIEDKEI